MKKLLILSLALLTAASSALAFQYWGDDYNTWDLGENLLDFGYSTFSSYAGAPVIVNAFGQKCLQLQPSEGGSKEYNMILTPLMGGNWASLAASGLLPENFDVVLKGEVCPGSDVDLLALYTSSTNRFFYFNFNKGGKVSTNPATKEFDVVTDGLNDVAATLHYSEGAYTITSVSVNGELWTGSVAIEGGEAPSFMRLSTQLTSLAEGGSGAIFGSVATDFVAADSHDLYVEQFSEEPLGDTMGSKPGWAFFNTYTGGTEIKENFGKIEGKAMVLEQVAGGSPDYVMLLTPAFEMTPQNPGSQKCVVSAEFVCGSQTDLFALYDRSMNRFFYLKGNAGDGILDSYPAGVTFSNLYTDAESLNKISIEWDPLTEKVIAVSCNGETQECSILPSGTCAMPARLRLSTQLTSLIKAEDGGSAYTYVKSQAVNRSSDPSLYCGDEACIALDTTSVKFPLYNAGPETGTVTFSADSDQRWLTITPQNGSFNVSQELTLSIDPEAEPGFYRAVMTVNAGAAGTRTVDVTAQNGVLYAEDFETMQVGNLVGQRGWTVDAGNAWVTNQAYSSQGQCGFLEHVGGSNGASFYLPKPWYENLIVKVQCDLYWPSDSPAGDGYIIMKDSGTAEKFEAMLEPKDDGLAINYIQISKNGGDKNLPMTEFPHAPFDTWFTFEYTIDLQAQKLLSFGWDGVLTNFNDVSCKNPKCNYYNSFGLAAWSGGGSNVAFDNLVISKVEREDEPKPAAEAITELGHGDSGKIVVSNAGGGSCAYTASFSDLDDVLTIKNPTGVLKDVVNVQFTVDRTGLGDGFFRSFLLTDCGDYGVLTSLVTFASGNVYYSADFEAPFFVEGDFGGQDSWSPDWGNNVANIIVTNDNQVAEIEVGGGYGGYMRNISVPTGAIMRVDFDFLLPEDRFPLIEEIGENVLYLKQQSQYNPLLEIKVHMGIEDGVNVIYGDVGDDIDQMPRIEDIGEFFHCSYTMDMTRGRLTEFTIDDVSCMPDYDVYLNFEGTPCNLICFCVASHMNVQLDNVVVSVVPEPCFAFAGLLLLLALARKRG